MRVMNVKFVGRIIMTILFVFICIGAYAGDDLLKYEIEGEGVGVQGTYLVKVTVIQKKSKLDIDVIKKCAEDALYQELVSAGVIKGLNNGF